LRPNPATRTRGDISKGCAVTNMWLNHNFFLLLPNSRMQTCSGAPTPHGIHPPEGVQIPAILSRRREKHSAISTPISRSTERILPVALNAIWPLRFSNARGTSGGQPAHERFPRMSAHAARSAKTPRRHRSWFQRPDSEARPLTPRERMRGYLSETATGTGFFFARRSGRRFCRRYWLGVGELEAVRFLFCARHCAYPIKEKRKSQHCCLLHSRLVS